MTVESKKLWTYGTWAWSKRRICVECNLMRNAKYRLTDKYKQSQARRTK